MYALLEFAEPLDPGALILAKRGSRLPAVAWIYPSGMLPLGFKIISADEPDRECEICLEDLPIGHIGIALLCHHWFGDGCIAEWLRRNESCPKCRRRVTM